MKRAFVLACFLLFSLADTALAGGPAHKATGSGMWTNQGGNVQVVDFNAHEAKDNRTAKGALYQAEVNGAWAFWVEVDYVQVYESHACFGGEIVAGEGSFASRVGQYRWTVVVDGGEGGDAADYLRGGQASPAAPPGWCSSGDTAGNQPFASGNVQIH